MLVLSRARHETVLVRHKPTGDVCKVEVVRIGETVVKLGFDGRFDEFEFVRGELEVLEFSDPGFVA